MQTPRGIDNNGVISARNRLIYRVRTAPDGRGRQLVWEFFLELPRQFVRRLLGRPAAKPIRTLVGGYSDAIRVLPRLVSAEYDRRRWREYLESLDWPGEI